MKIGLNFLLSLSETENLDPLFIVFLAYSGVNIHRYQKEYQCTQDEITSHLRYHMTPLFIKNVLFFDPGQFFFS